MSQDKGFEFPEFYSFPPFFTIQPVLESRERQMALWRQLILRYHVAHKRSILVLHDCPLWRNHDIGRSLSPADVQLVVQDLIDAGHGEWLDDTDSAGIQQQQHTTCRILWRTPEQLAADIYQWAKAQGHVQSVVTLYELHSGEDVHGTSFQGVDEELLRRALAVLEQQGKCTIFKGETSLEDGIKFF